MALLRAVRGFFEEIRLNFGTGAIAWALHRITGIALVIYLVLHLIVLSSAMGGARSFQSAFATLDNGPFVLLESAVVLAAGYHMFNGLRIAVIDFFGLTRRQKQLSVLVGIATLGVLVWTTTVVFDRFFGHG